MPRFERLRTPVFEAAAAALLAINVFLTACGSSSVAALGTIGRPGRWVALFALAVVAALLAVRSRHGSPARALRLLLVPAGVLVALAFLSTGWSVDPRLTFERAVTLVLGIGTAVLLAYAAERSPTLPRRLLEGVAAGGIAVVAAGLAVYAFDHAAAVQPRRPGSPARWQGIGENPNTVSMLAGVDLGVTLWLATSARRGRTIWSLGAAAIVLTILASGSRGALVAGVLGALAVGIFVPEIAWARVGAAVAIVVVGITGPVLVDAVAAPGGLSAAVNGTTTNGSGSGGGSGETIAPGTRHFASTGASGRLDAWRRAVHEGRERPLLGYGFGTEEIVFVPRFTQFHGVRPENSIIGLFLQLGVVGVAALLAALAAVAWAALTGLWRRTPEAPAVAAVCAAGGVLLLVQSYVYSMGNVAAMTFWVVAALGTGLARSRAS